MAETFAERLERSNGVAWCCLVLPDGTDCPNDAEWRLTLAPGGPDDSTDTCGDHVGAALADDALMDIEPLPPVPAETYLRASLEPLTPERAEQLHQIITDRTLPS